MNSIDDMVDVVVATCTLHNICLQANDTSDEICDQNSQLSGNDDDVPERNETCTTSATAKRDLIAQFLFHNYFQFLILYLKEKTQQNFFWLICFQFLTLKT